MIDTQEGTLSWKRGLWSTSGVLLSLAVGINVGLRLKAAKTRKAKRVGLPELPLAVNKTSSVDETLAIKSHTALADPMPSQNLPAITSHAFVATTEIEIPQPAAIAEAVIEPTASDAQLTDAANSVNMLLPTSPAVHEISKADESLCARLFPTFTAIWRRIRQVSPRQSKKRLRVCETVSLGEKRFVAVIQVDSEQFLVGGSSNSVSTLAHLAKPRDFSQVFSNRYQQDFSQA